MPVMGGWFWAIPGWPYPVPSVATPVARSDDSRCVLDVTGFLGHIWMGVGVIEA